MTTDTDPPEHGSGPVAAEAAAPPTAATFLAAIELTATEPVHFDRAFLATTQPCPWPKAYGGDMVAQATTAALRSVAADRALHSMHSYFLRPVEIGAQIRYEVELLRDGRSFSTRQIRAYQADKVVYVGLASFQVLEPGADHHAPMPTGMPDPESLPSAADALVGVPGPAARYWSFGRSFDQRHVTGPIYTGTNGGPTAVQAVWLRPFSRLPDDQQVHTAALAYVCDYTILEPLLRQQGLAWADEGLVTASLDHAMWFHRPARLDDWVLYSQQAVSAQHARGLAVGHLHTRSGELLATVAQEGMIRAPGSAGSSQTRATSESRRP
ncbi:acyl-CoA thioesterase domain-containing protein [Nakamurella sp. A5-74]|uniref:Acyl-CoA thioesterase domain-containing protein n=1 Tax=Nakamurella sp. A5-74 TaxID=3158264 RepID=A0AAU8DNU2_9ACTN